MDIVKETDLVKDLFEIAKNCLIKDKALAPMSFFVRGMSTNVEAMSSKTDEDLKKSLFRAGFLAGVNDCDYLLILHDACMKQFNSGDIEEISKDITCHPATYPKNMRQEGIVMFAVKLKEATNTIYVMNYELNDDNSAENFGNVETFKDGIDGPIVDIAIDGYRHGFESKKLEDHFQ